MASPSKAQDFLEADPYWDQSTVPVNTYKNKAPFIAKVISVKRIVGPEVSSEQICRERCDPCRRRQRRAMRRRAVAAPHLLCRSSGSLMLRSRVRYAGDG